LPETNSWRIASVTATSLDRSARRILVPDLAEHRAEHLHDPIQRARALLLDALAEGRLPHLRAPRHRLAERQVLLYRRAVARRVQRH
jgi:hypothetical protein